MTNRRVLWLLPLTALVLIGARQSVHWVRHADTGPAAGAEWIWAHARGEPGTPMAFFAVKDFELAFKPRTAELRILADEEYHVTLNGRGLAAGRYRDGNGLDAYPVGRALERGWNRIFVELRSVRGVGGMLLRLDASGADGQSVTVVSDGSWRILRRFDPDAVRPGHSQYSEDPVVWGVQPAGRWGLRRAAPRALTMLRLQGKRRRRPVPAKAIRLQGHRWLEVEPGGREPLGPWVSFDFRSERVGFLNLHFADAEASTAYVYYGLRRPREGLGEHDDVIIRANGRALWTACAPARFRFVTIVGASAVAAAGVLAIEADLAAGLLEARPRLGLFGFESPPTLVSPVEDEVRRKLEGVAGFARRERG
ncbi:MAG: hypothetical protein O7A04_04405 [Acidobacteria bacterium]|nr:hypothetical protein [Acidobacteriota bacterium]